MNSAKRFRNNAKITSARPCATSVAQRRCCTARCAAQKDAKQPSGTTKVAISLDVGDQVEQMMLPLDPASELQDVSLSFPLGLVFEAREGQVVVAEVEKGGAADVAGIRAGDVLRATSCAAMRMTYPTAQLMFGGVGRPKLMRALVPVTGFSSAMDAVRSNKQLGDGITLFLEREKARSGGKDGGDGGGGSESIGAAAEGSAETQQWQKPGSLFDASLFDE